MNFTILFIYSKWWVLGIIQDRGRELSVLMRREPSFFNFYVYSLIIRCMRERERDMCAVPLR